MWWQRFLILVSTAAHYPLLKFILETFHTLWNMDLHLPHPYPIALHTYSNLSFLLALPLPPLCIYYSSHLLLSLTLHFSFFSDYLFLSLPTSCSGHLELRFYLFRHFRFTLNFLYCTAPSSVSLGGQGEERSQHSIVARIDIWVSSMSDDSWILNVG